MKKLIVLATAFSFLAAPLAAVAQPVPPPQQGGPQKPGPQKPAPDWRKKGGKVPHGQGSVVNDYRAYHLKKPPRGYHWVRVGNDYILVAIASGIISSILWNAAR